MAKPIAKTIVVGIRLDVFKAGTAGDMEWERAPFLFDHRDEALEYKNRKHPNVNRFRIYKVRVPAPDKNQSFHFTRTAEDAR